MLGLLPRRLDGERGRYALVDGIPFRMPVVSKRMQALMAAFPIDADAARTLLPNGDVRPVRLWSKGLLVITVVNYQETVIGKYIEFSIALACAHRDDDPPPLLPFVFRRWFNFGQYVLDLPVSTEISVKGGKGIWGMPKHRASLNFEVGNGVVSSQYDDDGQLAMYVEIERPKELRLPLSMGASNYCEFRGMLMKSDVYFRGRAGFALGGRARAKLELGPHPRLRMLERLDIGPKPVFTAFFPDAHGVLDDHAESWFLSYERPPDRAPEGMESVIGLGLSQEWPPPPTAAH
jgi:hypothetical protein